MKNFARRAAALTPSITVALIAFTVGLTGLLAYRAFDASRAQRLLVERTLRDYAGFAAFQLKNATVARISVLHRQAADSAVRWINARGPTPELGARRLESLIAPRGPQCRCINGVAFYYQVSFADSSVESTPSPLATPENLRVLRDTILAHAATTARNRPVSPPLPGVPITPQYFYDIFTRLDGRVYLLSHALTVRNGNLPGIGYGYVIPAERAVGEAVRFVLDVQPLLPRTLTRDLAADSILAIRITDPARHLIYETAAPVDERYAAADSLDPRIGGLRFEVSIQPSAAGRLIIGGLPRSRLPEVLATSFVAVSLLGLLLFQFRRQEELGRLREQFVSGVSHELRTPLAQIRLLAELLRLGKVPSEDKERSLRIIDQEARRLSFLVDSILNFSRAQDAPLAPVRTNLAADINEIVSGFAPLAEAQSVRLMTRVEPDLVADVDRGALRQVLLNLLDNAVRYGPAGQTVIVSVAADGDEWTLEVLDEGPGVPVDERERIFAPYYRLKRDAGGADGGSGIGLAVVHRLVRQHGGDVRVTDRDSSPGARFIVTLPLRAATGSGA